MEANGIEVPPIDAWNAWRPEETAERLAGVGVQWAVAAGWAIELFVGREPRSHADIEIVVPHDSFPAIAAALPELDWYGAGDGRICMFEDTPEHFHQTWGWDRSHGCWRVDVFREPWHGETWICRRDPSIHRPWSSVVEWTREGVPYIAPEIVLLFKAKHAQLERNKIDLVRTLPLLEPQRRRWLMRALQIVHPDHEWIDAVDASEGVAQ